jgi:hypothetical protein
VAPLKSGPPNRARLSIGQAIRASTVTKAPSGPPR